MSFNNGNHRPGRLIRYLPVWELEEGYDGNGSQYYRLLPRYSDRYQSLIQNWQTRNASSHHDSSLSRLRYADQVWELDENNVGNGGSQFYGSPPRNPDRYESLIRAWQTRNAGSHHDSSLRRRTPPINMRTTVELADLYDQYLQTELTLAPPGYRPADQPVEPPAVGQSDDHRQRGRVAAVNNNGQQQSFFEGNDGSSLPPMRSSQPLDDSGRPIEPLCSGCFNEILNNQIPEEDPPPENVGNNNQHPDLMNNEASTNDDEATDTDNKLFANI